MLSSYIRIRRPVCLFCTVLIFLLLAFTKFKPPEAKWDVDSAKDTSIILKGKVVDKQIKNDNLLIYLKDVIDEKGILSNNSQGIIAYISAYEGIADLIRLGSVISVKGVFMPFSLPANEGEFDARHYYLIRGYDGTLQRARVLGVSKGYNRIKEGLRLLRQEASRILYLNMRFQNASVAEAMTLGDKTNLDDEIKESYQLAGIAHVLALSGLHIAAIGLAMLKVLRRCGINIYASSIISGVIISLYSVMTGSSISTIRAVIMFLLGAIASCIGRSYDLLTAAALSAILILVDTPFYVYDCGFQLSFGAVIGIGIVFPIVENLTGIKDCKLGFVRKILESILVSISITLVTLPIIAYNYFQITVYSVVLNILIIPLMTVILFTAFTGMIIGMVGVWIAVNGIIPKGIADLTMHISRFAHKITDGIIGLYNTLSMETAGFDGNIIVIGRPAITQIFIYYCLVGVGLYVCSRIYNEKTSSHFIRNRWKNFTNILSFGLFIFCAFLTITYRKREVLEIRNIYVGQGDGTLICGDDYPTILIDGGSSDIKNVGKYKIIPVIKSNGISKIDYCFITHMDSDHYSGVLEILRNPQWGIHISNIVLSESYLRAYQENPVASRDEDGLVEEAIKQNVSILKIKTGDILKRESAIIACVSPDQDEKYKGNDSSIVLKIGLVDSEFKGIFTGDISCEKEKEIIERLSDITYLKVAHHGSKYSTTEDFLKKCRPEIAVISAGVDNSYGHPHKEALERLNKFTPNAKVLRTDECGQVTIKVSGGKEGKCRYMTMNKP